MKETMQGLLLASFVNCFLYSSATSHGSVQQATQVPDTDSDIGNIRLGKVCESSLECISQCCLFNKTAGVFTCQRLNQRYSNCSPWRPKILTGTLLDVYLHHCPCKQHLRCAQQKAWHVCLRRKHLLGQPDKLQRPGGGSGKPTTGKPPVKPPVKPNGKSPVWPNGTLNLGQPCATSIDCKSECCVYNPQIGFAFCHRLEQIYDDCSPWHPDDEKGTLVDVYFKHCPCKNLLQCTKQKKWHICRKKGPFFGMDKPSQEAIQQQEVQRPQLQTQKPSQPQAIGTQRQVVQTPQSETQKPSEQVVELKAVGQAQTHQRRENGAQQVQEKPLQEPLRETPTSGGQKAVPLATLQKPDVQKPEKPVRNITNIPQPQKLQRPSQQTGMGGRRTFEVDNVK